jgi:16S rRNA (uracil1498-N3)-methyltransferase
LDQEESRHCIRVLRKRKGDEITVLDGQGGIYTCRITNANHKETEFEILKSYHDKQVSHEIHIGIAPTKNMDRIEWFLEKSIEVGIRRITFILCENSERNRINMDRLVKKAISAMKQSHHAYLPEISDLVSFRNLVENIDQSYEKFLCHAEKGNGNYLLHTATKGRNYCVLIGPEGDFTNDELQLASQNGYEMVSLGNSRLRTETAGFVACTLLNALNVQHR